MHDNVSPEGQWLLQVGAGEGVVYHQQCTCLMGNRGQCSDVGDAQHLALLPCQFSGAFAQAHLSPSAQSGLLRVADVPIYRSDNLVRHAQSLQQTRASATPMARLNPSDLQRLGLASGAKMKCTQEGGAAEVLELIADSAVAPGVALISAACAATKNLGAMIGPIELERA